MRAKGQIRKNDASMNKTEAARACMLDTRKAAGEIVAWWFQGWTFKLGDDCRYTPDFILQLADGALEAEEVKGFFRDDALVKCKVFARMFPMKLTVVSVKAKKHGGGWEERIISA